MIHGLDTSFLVAVEVAEHDEHQKAKKEISELLVAQDQVGIAPQVLAEFVHIVTDPRRLAAPLSMSIAINIAEQWWTARETIQIFPTSASVSRFVNWMKQHSLGRKRLLDTILAATYSEFGISSILTLNYSDFAIFGAFTTFTPPSP